MECLNAEPTRALALATPRDPPDISNGLDLCLEKRMAVPGKTVVPIIAEVLCSAGIAEMTDILDRQLHRPRKGIRLLPPWTWHIGAALRPSVRLGDTREGASLSWMDVCPVCRTGILDRVAGKQLFGVPRTDFIIECSHCGGKFIPVGQAFRLVSIATIRDPLWKKHLDKTYPPEQWASLARGTTPGGNPAPRQALKNPPSSESRPQPLPPATVTLVPLKDGSLAVPVSGRTVYFRPVPLQFTGPVRGDAFARILTPLEEILGQPAFSHLVTPVNAKYSRYLPLKTGLFLQQLKDRHDPFYREFLNPYGDEKYGTFRSADSTDTGKKGVMIVAVKHGLYHVAGSPDPLGTTINRFGRVGSDDCLLSGRSDRCRINALLCTNRNDAGIFIHPVEDEDEREALLHAVESLLAVGRS
jgi:hypothetical protein